MNILITMPKNDVFYSFFDDEIIEELKRIGNVKFNELGHRFNEEQLCNELKDIDVCITGWGDGPFTDKVLDNCNKLKIIAHSGGSVGALTRENVYEKNIKVISGNEIYAQSVAEGVLCYILASLRRLPYYIDQMKSDGWSEKNWYNEGLIGKKVGLIGFGAVAKQLVKLLNPFDCKIYVYADHVSETEAKEYGIIKMSSEDIFSTCDVISIQLAQNDETYHYVSKPLLERLRPNALLVNTSRGSIVDEVALCQTIDKIGYKAILDVYEQEPLPMESCLRNNERIILIPHMAGPTMDKRKYVTINLIKEIDNILNGKSSYLEITKEKMQHMTK